MKEIRKFRGKFRFLSNFYPTPVLYVGVEYPSSEHAYQAAKTLNVFEREIIRSQVKPAAAKKVGRLLTIREDWEEAKLDVMRDILLSKFSVPQMRTLLLSTGDALLVEGNYWHDNYWGECSCPKCSQTASANHLGRILMEVRSELREG